MDKHTRLSTLLCVTVLTVISCGEPAETPADPPATNSVADPDIDPAVDEGPTYRRDIRPILDASCMSCHAGGGVAPHSFEKLETVQSLAPLMLSEMQTGSMPPWALSDECGEFAGDIRPSAEAIATFEAWIDGGMPDGTGETVTVEQPLEPPMDISFVLDPGSDYATVVGANDDYRCFILEPDIDAETFVTGMQVRSTAPDIVHHVLIYSISDPAEETRLIALDEADATPGYECFGGPGTTRFNAIAAWAPGDRNVRLPEGTGVRVRPGRRLVVQLHYSGAGTDRTTVGFSTDPEAQEAFTILIGDVSLALPPGNPEARSLLQFSLANILPVPVPVKLRAMFPHMHLRGRRLTVTRTNSEGAKDCLIDAPRYDFNWQRFYDYAEPLTLNPSDQLSLECVFDTTNADETVRWGENTTDEMCVIAVYATL